MRLQIVRDFLCPPSTNAFQTKGVIAGSYPKQGPHKRKSKSAFVEHVSLRAWPAVPSLVAVGGFAHLTSQTLTGSRNKWRTSCHPRLVLVLRSHSSFLQCLDTCSHRLRLPGSDIHFLKQYQSLHDHARTNKLRHDDNILLNTTGTASSLQK